jgi:putative hemolysin
MIHLSIWHLLCFIPPLLLIEGFFSGSEIALLSADKLTLKQEAKNGKKGASLALELANHPERVFSTTLLFTSLCIITSSALIELYLLSIQSTFPNLFAILITSPLIVIFGELVPKTLFQRNATRLAPWVARPLYMSYCTLYPLTRLISYYTTRLSRFVGPIGEYLSGKTKTTREDIQALLSYTRKETEIKSSEKQMIGRILDFKYTEAKNALIPLVKVDAISVDATVEEALESFDRHRHSRIPVYSGRIDNIIGILESTDLLSAHDLKESIQFFISTAQYAPESQALIDLMHDMKKEDNEMVVVVDEHGGAIGILTFEDIVEEIVGEISDEYDYESLPYRVISERSWILQARMEIQQINDVLKIQLPEGDYETLSGFLLQQFGRIPEKNDELFFSTPTGDYRFVIQTATERHIETVMIEKLSDAPSQTLTERS